MREPSAEGAVPSAKTVANKHGFLSGGLTAAVRDGHISANPCTGMRMPRDDDPEQTVVLTGAEFAQLLANVTEYWQPMVQFLV